MPEIRASSSRLRLAEKRGYIVGLSTIEPTRPMTLCSPAGGAPPPAGRPNQAQEAPDRRSLAGAVRPEEAEHATARDGQIQAVDRHGPAAADPSILLAEPLDLDDRVHPMDTVRRGTRRPHGR